jgi:hypothetical protein
MKLILTYVIRYNVTVQFTLYNPQSTLLLILECVKWDECIWKQYLNLIVYLYYDSSINCLKEKALWGKVFFIKCNRMTILCCYWDFIINYNTKIPIYTVVSDWLIIYFVNYCIVIDGEELRMSVWCLWFTLFSCLLQEVRIADDLA